LKDWRIGRAPAAAARVGELGMAKPIRGFQINTILDRLARDMLSILQQCLARAPLDRDRLHLTILLTLSRRTYVENLLYRDYRVDRDSQWYSWRLPDGREARIQEQAIVYLHKVLARRPKLARRLRDEPGNMHFLFCFLCRYGPAAHGWRGVVIRRDKQLTARGEAPDFVAHLALELAAQRARLGADYSEDSARRRAEYGPIWLIRGDCAAELPEEMSLFDAVEAAPVPLDVELVEDAEVQRILVRVLDALNERYMLLRACGLDPELWHDRDEPSIARLREMKQLRKPAEELMRTGIEDDNVAAYRRAFGELKGGAKEFAGCASFDEFATSEAGMAMLRYASLSLDEPIATDDEGEEWTRREMLADPDAEDVEESVIRRRAAGQWVELLIADRPDWFDPLMHHFFTQVLGQGRPLHAGPGDAGVINDPELRALIDSYPELKVLDAGALADELCRRAEAIIKRGLRRDARANP
jgi:hypothetical protein